MASSKAKVTDVGSVEVGGTTPGGKVVVKRPALEAAAKLAAADPEHEAAPRVDAEGQPTEFAVDLDEWEAGRPAFEYALLAGFRHFCRAHGTLRHKRLRADWAAQFEEYKTT